MHTLKTTLSAAILAPALSLSALPAHAIDLTVNPLLAGQTFSYEQDAPAFSDSLTFTIGEPLDFVLSFSNLQMGSRASLSVFLNGNEIVGTFGRNLTWSWGPFGSVPAFPVGTSFVVTVSGTDSTLDTPSYALSLSAVPEPSTWALLGVGLLAVASAFRGGRRR